MPFSVYRVTQGLGVFTLLSRNSTFRSGDSNNERSIKVTSRACTWIKIVQHSFESLASGFKNIYDHSVCIYIYICAHKVTDEERRVAYAHLGAKPTLVETRRELFVMPCLNYSGSRVIYAAGFVHLCRLTQP